MATTPHPANPSNTPASTDITIEEAKRNAANLAVAQQFPQDATLVGIGSGTTITYVVEAIKALNLPNVNDIHFVPTGYQSRSVIHGAGLRDRRFDSIPPGVLIDIAFDGADEVDDELNCIKGGGACMYQEKLVATQARRFVCVAGMSPLTALFLDLECCDGSVTDEARQQRIDHRKLQKRLLTKWPSIPIEVEPLATSRVLGMLRLLGSGDPRLRHGSMEKAGPIKTDQDNFIIDAPFKTLVLPSDLIVNETEARPLDGSGNGGVWEVAQLSRAIKSIEGVLSVGIFSGYNGLQAANLGDGTGGQKPVAAYFGMTDGSVIVKKADESGKVSAIENPN